MARLKTSERKDLPDSAFAYIDAKGRRRLPINDEPHVRNALARFERVAFESDEARERARTRLLKAAKRYGIVPVGFITGQIRSERAPRPADRKAFPTGSVTFLMTDIEGSTELLRRLGRRYPSVLSETRKVLRRAVRASGGHEVDAHADEYFASFERASDALDAALAIQRMLGEHTWPDGLEVRVRAGVHGGRPTLTDTGYVGISVHTVARICSAGHGGQILVSEQTKRAVKAMPAGVRLRSLGRHPLAGLPKDESLFQVVAKGLRADFPPPRTAGVACTSVDVELVPLRVLHRDRVVVEAFGIEDSAEPRTEIDKTGRLRVDALLARLDRNRAATARPDIDVPPVLDRLALRYDLEPDPRPFPAGIDDAVRAPAELIFRHAEVSLVRIPAGEAVGRRFELVAQRGGPEARERLRVGAVDHQLEAHGHRSLLGVGDVSSAVCVEPLTPSRRQELVRMTSCWVARVIAT